MIRHLLAALGFGAGVSLGWTLEAWHLGSTLERCNASAEHARADRAEADAVRWKQTFDAAERMRQRESAAASAAMNSLIAEKLAAARAADVLRVQLARERIAHANNPAYAVCSVSGATRRMLDEAAGAVTGANPVELTAAAGRTDAKASAAEAAPPLTLDQCTEGYANLAAHDRNAMATVSAWQDWARRAIAQSGNGDDR